jgi:hypothetical protein
MSKTDIQKGIEDVIAQIVHLNVVRAHLDETKKALNDQYVEIEQMNTTLSKELRDLERLEGLSTKAIFHKILGNREQQLDKERQEYLEMSMKYEDLQKSIKILEYEENLLSAKVEGRADLESKLESLKRMRETEIIQSEPLLRDKLLRLSNDLESNYHLKKELEEAIEAGNICANLIIQVIGHLEKVRNWGSFRKSGRSGMQRMMNRDSIDRARNLSFQVKHHLQLFDRELRDIGQRLNFNFDTIQFSDFTDFFFNNIITDWILQQKLASALSSVNQTLQHVKIIIANLEQEYNSTIALIEKFRQERDLILIK